MSFDFPFGPRWRSGAKESVPWWVYARRIALSMGFAVGLLIIGLMIFLFALIPTTPGVNELRALQETRPSVLLSSDGKLLTTFRRALQERVPLAQISPHVVNALIATEDQHFYEHHGIDLYRTIGAVAHTIRGDTQGGSTITQQLARNLFPQDIGRSNTLKRKAKELVTALRIERNFSKTEILENYLNSAPFLYNVVGIEMAARAYYDTSAADLDVLQSATLVGMLKGTRYYNPVLNPERAKERRNLVLAQMVKRNVLTQDEYSELRKQPLNLRFKRPPDMLGDAPHFAVALRKWLVGWADEHHHDLYSDGLVVHSTIDSRLQEAATRAVSRQAKLLQSIADVEWSSSGMRLTSTSPDTYLSMRSRVDPFAHFWNKRRDLVALFVRESPEFRAAVKTGSDEATAMRRLMSDGALMTRLKKEKTRLEAGFVAMDPRNGEVKAWIGSRDFDTDQYDHVALAARQPGSTFKPFVYGAALESGLSPDHIYIDEPIDIRLDDGTVWRPTDMSASSGEPMTLRDGLIHSRNVITAQVAQEIGIPRIVVFAESMGVTQSKLDPVPSLALGTSPVTLLEMVNAYSTIAAQGQYHKPVMIERISNRHGEVLAEFNTEARPAMSSEAAVDLIDMMRGVIDHGTGTQIKSRFGIVNDMAGKTGTTQNNTDGWFILMHPHLVAGAWVGFNDSRVTMRSNYWGQGGHNAILLVGDFFRTVSKRGLVDNKASFPLPRRPEIAPGTPWPSDQSQIDASSSQGTWPGESHEATSPVIAQPDETLVPQDRDSTE